MTSTLGSETTQDAFLGGRLTLEQPRKGYRAGVDPVLMAAAVRAKAGQSVLELGCGTGAALLCLGVRVPGLALHGVELQEGYADLCRTNSAANGIDAQIWTADLAALPDALRALSFDHVIANPPYFERARGGESQQPDRDIAFRGATPLADWIDTARRRLRHKGWLTMIQHIERLPETLALLDGRWGALRVYPICGRSGHPASRFLLRARKGGQAPFTLAPPIALHEGERHLRDGEDYRPEIKDVLRNGAELPLSD